MSARPNWWRRAACAAPMLLAWSLPLSAVGAERVFDVCQFGAKPDGATLATAAIQQAIDRAATQGGGAVRLGPGTFLSGSVYLKSRVTLQLDKGARLLGSPRIDDYVDTQSLAAGHPGTKQRVATALVVAQNIEHVAIRGQGTIDGNGTHFRDKSKRRPKNLMLVDCRDVTVEGVRMEAAGSWMQHYRNCDRLTIRGIHVFNHVSYNNDGLDLDGCHDVVIADCVIDSDDDAVVLKSLSQRPCRNVTVSNCTISSHCNAIMLGTESGGGFQNITVRDCRVFSPRHAQVTYGKQRGLAGIALEIVDGGRMDAVRVSNIQIEGVTTPIFLRLGDRGRTFGAGTARPPVGTLQNVSLSQITATGVSPTGCSITGLPDHPVQNVSLTDIRLTFEGNGVAAHAVEKVPERPAAYPESTMFGVLPAYGFYCRHVENLTLRNITLRTSQSDLRHALVFDDARAVRVDGLDAQYSSGAAAPIRLVNSKAVQLERIRAAGAPRLLQE